MAITVDVTPNNTTVSPEESVTTTLDITTSIPTISAFLPLLSVNDAGGDGSLAYSSSNGEFTYTGPSASEVRAHLSAGTGVTYSSGQFSIGQDVATTADVQFNNTTVGRLNILTGGQPFLNFYNGKNIASGLTSSSTEFTAIIPFYGITLNGSTEQYMPSGRIFSKFTNCTTSNLTGQMVFEVAKAGASSWSISDPNPKNVMVLDPGTVTIGVGGTGNALDLTDLVVNGSLDINGDASIAGAVTDVTTLTASGEIEGGSLDINGNADISGTATADEFVGDLRGAVRFQAKAGESLAKGDVVYISSVSGQKPVVSKARADSATTMPAFGLANATVNNNANLEVISFGTFAHGDTTGGAENWEFGDVLYISSTTAGALTNLKPSGESNLIQNVGKVERVHASSGSIMVAGAGRTAATPNLDEGNFFIGDSNNYSSIGSFNNQFINTSGTISLSNNIAISGELEGGSLDINGNADISGNLVLGGNLTVSGTETILNSTTLSIDDKNIVLGSVDTPTDTTADGGGITLKGATDKTINWVNSTDSWTSSENFELASEKTFRINANEVLSQTTLGSTVLSSSLTSVGTIGTGVWQGTAIANNYIGPIDASKIGSGTLHSLRLSGSYTGITGIGSISSLNIAPPSGTTGNLTHISRGGNASFVLSGVGAVGDADYVAPGQYVVSGAASAAIVAPSITLVGALGVTGDSTVNGALTVNNDSMEVVSTDDGATAKPILSLYRNSPTPANNDRMGGIRFFGNNNADPVQKTFYAGIDAVSSNVTADNNVGSLRFYLADQSSTSSPITDVSANITDDEDPVMTLHKHGLVMGANNDLFLDDVDDVLKWSGGTGQSLRGRASDNGTASVITLPDVISGTLAVTEAETFTGGMTVEGGLTSSPSIQVITGATTSVNNSTFLGYAGKRIMVTTTNALTMDLPDSAAGDEGKTWVIMNASNNEITLDADNNGTAQYFRILTGGSVITANQSFGGIKNIKITKGGIAELVCLGNGNSFSSPSYLIFGSGVHYE